MANGQKFGSDWPIIDLTSEGASSRNPSILCIDATDRDADYTEEFTDLTPVDYQRVISITPIIDLTQDNQSLDDKILTIDLTDDVKEITSRIQYIDSTSDIRESHKIIKCLDLAENEDTNFRSEIKNFNDNKDFDLNATIDLTSDDQLLNKSVTDISMTNFIQDINQVENNDLKDNANQNVNVCIPANDSANDSDKRIDQNIPNDDLFCNKGCVKNRPAIDLMRNDDNFGNDADENMSANFPVSWKTADTDNYRRKILQDGAIENNAKICAKISSKNLMQAGTSSTIQQSLRRNMTSNLMKTARYPIPLRHSFGRSTVNTSKNVLIEITDASEGHSRILTVSSALLRKKPKPRDDISEESKLATLEHSSSRRNAFYFDTFHELFLRIWIFLIYWISKMIKNV